MSDRVQAPLSASLSRSRPEPLLSVRDLRVSLGSGRKRTRVLHGVDARVDAGEIVGLIGETGSGKTTLARSILGLNRFDSGTVRLATAGRTDNVQSTEHGSSDSSIDIGSLSPRALRTFRRAGDMQYVFQDPLQSLDPDLTVFASIAEGLHVRATQLFAARGEVGSTRQHLRARVENALDLVGLPTSLADRLPGDLSGGQRQRVAIARAMILEPRLLICDEPVSALDATNRIAMLELLSSLRYSRPGIGLLFISHDLGSVAGITDRILVLYRGVVVEEGTTAEILRVPAHPYTQLLVGSAPTLTGGEADRERRRELRLLLAATE